MLIKVKVFPNSKKQEIIKKSENSFEVKVKEKPIMGKVNRGVIKIFSEFFEISESKIKLIRGFKQKNKIFEINIPLTISTNKLK